MSNGRNAIDEFLESLDNDISEEKQKLIKEQQQEQEELIKQYNIKVKKIAPIMFLQKKYNSFIQEILSLKHSMLMLKKIKDILLRQKKLKHYLIREIIFNVKPILTLL